MSLVRAEQLASRAVLGLGFLGRNAAQQRNTLTCCADLALPLYTRASQSTMEAEETQVSVKFVTHLPEQYKVPEDVLVCTVSGLTLRARSFFRKPVLNQLHCRACRPKLLGWACLKSSTPC